MLIKDFNRCPLGDIFWTKKVSNSITAKRKNSIGYGGSALPNNCELFDLVLLTIIFRQLFTALSFATLTGLQNSKVPCVIIYYVNMKDLGLAVEDLLPRFISFSERFFIFFWSQFDVCITSPDGAAWHRLHIRRCMREYSFILRNLIPSFWETWFLPFNIYFVQKFR